MKNTRKEMLDAIEKGQFVAINNFREMGASNTFRIITKIENGPIIQISIIPKGTNTLDKLIRRSFFDKADYNIQAKFDIKTEVLSMEKLEAAIENNTGINTSSIILGRELKPLISEFWDVNTNKYIDSMDGVNSLDSIIQNSIGQSSETKLSRTVDFKVFEESNGEKNMIKFEKIEDGTNLYNIQYVTSDKWLQTSVKIKNVIFEDGKFRMQENSYIDTPKYNEKREDSEQRAKEMKDLQGLLKHYNTLIDINEMSIQGFNNFVDKSIKEYGETFNDIFKVVDMHYELVDKIRDLDTKKDNILDYLMKTDKEVLITLLEEDGKMNRVSNVVDGADADEDSSKLIYLMKQKIMDEKNETFEKVVFSCVLELVKTPENPQNKAQGNTEDGIDEIVNRIQADLRCKLEKEIEILRDFKNLSLENFIVKHAWADNGFSRTIGSCFKEIKNSEYEVGEQSESTFNKRFNNDLWVSGKAEGENNKAPESGSEYSEADNINVNIEDLSPIVRFIVCKKVVSEAEKDDISMYNIKIRTERGNIDGLEQMKKYIKKFEERMNEDTYSKILKELDKSGSIKPYIDKIVECDKYAISDIELKNAEILDETPIWENDGRGKPNEERKLLHELITINLSVKNVSTESEDFFEIDKVGKIILSSELMNNIYPAQPFKEFIKRQLESV